MLKQFNIFDFDVSRFLIRIAEGKGDVDRLAIADAWVRESDVPTSFRGVPFKASHFS